jgi:hypothetical protein
MLEGRRFIIFTDHKPLMYTLRRSSDPWTARQCRQLTYIPEYTSNLRHIAGTSNIVADMLSWPPSPPTPSSTAAVQASQAELKAASVKRPPGSLAAAIAAGPPTAAKSASVEGCVDYAAMAPEQRVCPETTLLAAHPSLSVKAVKFGDTRLLCDWSMGIPWPLVPAYSRKAQVSGIGATRRLVAARMVWRGMKADLGRWCQD